MKMTPQSALLVLSRRVRNFATIKALEAGVASPDFQERFALLSGQQRMTISALVGERQVLLMGRERPVPTTTESKASKWTPDFIAKLKAAERKHGSDIGIARELGLTKKAAARARLRYIGTRAQIAAATSDQQKAA